MKNTGRVLVVSDSFKGTWTSEEICNMARKAQKYLPGIEIITIPVADGGEGTVSAFTEAFGAETVTVSVTGPFPGTEVAACYAIKENTAIIEMASTCGLALIESLGLKKDPFATTTYGTGELILDALKRGCSRILLGLGGSSTNDGGCGCAAALNTRFYNKDSVSFIPVGGTLKDIRQIDASRTENIFRDVSLTLMCDVTNPVTGPEGASYVFAPQKGAPAESLPMLDDGLKNLCKVIEHDLHKNITDLPGGGAAGGMGAGCAAFFNGEIVSGIDAVLDTVGFDILVESADLIVTGEGKLDSQSISGKVVAGVSRRAGDKTLIAIVGSSDLSEKETSELGLTAVFETGYDGDYTAIFTEAVKSFFVVSF